MVCRQAMHRHPGGGPWADSQFILQAEPGFVIDLHSHILPGVDDGAQTLEDAIAIGRMAEADGIGVMACTPHFMPGVYDNQSSDIRARVKHLNDIFEREGLQVAPCGWRRRPCAARFCHMPETGEDTDAA
jgi:hypothetical protein